MSDLLHSHEKEAKEAKEANDRAKEKMREEFDSEVVTRSLEYRKERDALQERVDLLEKERNDLHKEVYEWHEHTLKAEKERDEIEVELGVALRERDEWKAKTEIASKEVPAESLKGVV